MTEPPVSKRSGRASAEMNIDGKTIVFYGETSDEARGKAKAYEFGYSNGFHQRVDDVARVDDSAYYDGWFAGECQRLRENDTTVSPEHDPVHSPAHYTDHPTMHTESNLPDSGEREVKANGFMREPEGDKANYVPLLTARGIDIVPHELITRIAEHYYQGGLKYAPNNWMRGTDTASLERNRRSAARHFVAWLRGETDEDHLAAVTWNMTTYEINKAAGDQ